MKASRGTRILLLVLGISVSSLTGFAGAPEDSEPKVDYSADRYFEFPGGSVRERIYYSPGKERRETQDGTIFITRQDQQLLWMLFPEKKLARAMAGQSEQASADQPSFTPVEGGLVGEEVINGVNTTKYRIAITVEDVQFAGFMWRTAEGIVVKIDAVLKDVGAGEEEPVQKKRKKTKREEEEEEEEGELAFMLPQMRMRMELRNLRIGKLDPSLFEVPPDYVKVGESRSPFGRLGSPGEPAAPATERKAEPRPGSRPSDEIAQRAATLAEQVLAGGPSAEAALREAVLAAGFGVRESDGSSAPAGLPSALMIDHWQLQALVNGGSQTTVRLADLERGLATVLPELAGKPIGKMLLDDIRANARSSVPALRFWAQFIIELGRRSPEPYDLMGTVDPASVQLDGVQNTLIVQRLVADLRILAAGAEGQGPSPSSELRGYRTGPLLAALFPAPGGASPFLFMAAPAPSFQPCEVSGLEAEVSEWLVTKGANKAFGTLMKTLEEGGAKWAGKITRVIGVTNFLLAYIKLAYTLMNLEIEIGMDGENPLQRTRNRQPGERRQLTTKLDLKTGDMQFNNCLRQTLKKVGLNFDLPEEGPVEGAGVEWTLVEGGTRVDTKGSYKITDAIVEIENPGARVQTARGQQAKNFTQSQTNPQGLSNIGILGAAQKEPVTGHPIPVDKQFKVRVNVQLKPPKISKAVMTGAGIAIGGPGGLLTLPVDLIYQTRWPSKTETFPLTDWVDGYGTITYVETGQSAKAAKGGSRREGGTWERAYKESYQRDGRISVFKYHLDTPILDGKGHMVLLGGTQATQGQATYEENRRSDGACGEGGGWEATVEETRGRATGSAQAAENSREAHVRITAYEDGTYEIEAELLGIGLNGESTVRESRSITDPGMGACNENAVGERSEKGVASFVGEWKSITLRGKVDPANPDIWRGSGSFAGRGSGSAGVLPTMIKVEWELHTRARR